MKLRRMAGRRTAPAIAARARAPGGGSSGRGTGDAMDMGMAQARSLAMRISLRCARPPRPGRVHRNVRTSFMCTCTVRIVFQCILRMSSRCTPSPPTARASYYNYCSAPLFAPFGLRCPLRHGARRIESQARTWELGRRSSGIIGHQSRVGCSRLGSRSVSSLRSPRRPHSMTTRWLLNVPSGRKCVTLLFRPFGRPYGTEPRGLCASTCPYATWSCPTAHSGSPSPCCSRSRQPAC